MEKNARKKKIRERKKDKNEQSTILNFDDEGW